MKKILFLTLFLPILAFGQNTVTLPTPTTSYTPQFRYYGAAPDTLKSVYIFSGSVYNQIYTATQIARLFRTPNSVFTHRMDSLFALSATLAGNNTFTGTTNIFNGTVQVNGNFNMTGNADITGEMRSTTLYSASSTTNNLHVGTGIGGAWIDFISTGAFPYPYNWRIGDNVGETNDPFYIKYRTNEIVKVDTLGTVFIDVLRDNSGHNYLKDGDSPSDSSFNARIDTNTLVKRENLIYAIGDSKVNITLTSKIDSLLGSGWNVVNMSVSGALAFGTNVRFADVTNGTAKYVFIRVGSNDIAQDRSSPQLISDVQAMATKAHNAGIYVIVPTITPFGGNAMYSPAREIVRNDFNLALRNGTITNVNKVVDFSLLVRDAADTTRMDAAYTTDGLHENTNGYLAEANLTYSSVTFTKDNSYVTLNASRTMSFDQPLNTFSSTVFNSVSANTITAFGTNVTGNPSVFAQASARNNPAFVAKYLLPDHAVNLAEFKDYNDANLVAVGPGTTSGSFIQTITPQLDNTKGLLIKMPSATYSTNIFELQDYLGTIVARINQVGQIGATGIFNQTSSTNSNITLGTTGLTLSRNVADANHVATVQNLNSSSTGSIMRYIWGSNTTVGNFGARGLTLGSNTINTNTFHVLRATNGLGTVSVTATSGTVTGTGTDFQNRFNVGETITANGETHTISAIASDVSMTTDVWTNTFSGIYTATNKNNFIVNANGKIAITKMSVAGGLLYSSTTAGNIEESAAITGLVKGNGTGAPTQAVAGTDYAPVDNPSFTTGLTVNTSSTGTVTMAAINTNGGAASDVRIAASNGTNSIGFIQRGTAYSGASGVGYINVVGTGKMGVFMNGTERYTYASAGNFGIRTTSPTAALHLPAGTAGIGSGPFKMTAGTNMPVAEAGAIEFDGTNWYGTPTTVRKTFAFLESPAFTTTPTAPTAALGTNTTQLATTAFVIANTPTLSNYTASGTGAATTITIPHGLTGISGTSKVIVQPLNAASAGVTYVTIDSVNVSVVYTIAPALGTSNLNYTISIKP